MTDQMPPSFEDLEPEGDQFDDDGHRFGPEGFDPFLSESSDEYGDDPDDRPYEGFDDYEFSPEPEELQAFEENDRFSDEGNVSGTRSPLPTVAARTALKWAGQAHTGTWRTGNGRKPSVSKMESYPGRISSAAVQESYELIDTLSVAAAKSEDETESIGLVAAMVPVAIGLEPETYRALWPAIPVMVRGAIGVTKLLHRRSSSRPLIRLMPEILLRTIDQLADLVLEGRPASKRLTTKALARSTKVTLAGWTKSQQKTQTSREFKPRNHDEID